MKRENWDATAGFRKKYGQAVYLFNPTDPEGRTARYNPLGYIDRTDPDQVVIELQKIATMLFVPPERGEQRSISFSKSRALRIAPRDP